MEHSRVLCDFANHYGACLPPTHAHPGLSRPTSYSHSLRPHWPDHPALTPAAASSHQRPSPAEVAEMAQRATLVLQLVEHLRRMAASATGPGALSAGASATGVLGSAAASGLPSSSSPGGNAERASYQQQGSMSMGGDRDRERDRECDDKERLKGSKKRPWEDVVGAEHHGTEDAGGERSAEEVRVYVLSFVSLCDKFSAG